MAEKPLRLNATCVNEEIEDDSDFYDGRRYSPLFLEAGKTLTIPERNQMIICDSYEIEAGASLIIAPGAKVCIT